MDDRDERSKTKKSKSRKSFDSLPKNSLNIPTTRSKRLKSDQSVVEKENTSHSISKSSNNTTHKRGKSVEVNEEIIDTTKRRKKDSDRSTTEQEDKKPEKKQPSRRKEKEPKSEKMASQPAKKVNKRKEKKKEKKAQEKSQDEVDSKIEEANKEEQEEDLDEEVDLFTIIGQEKKNSNTSNQPTKSPSEAFRGLLSKITGAPTEAFGSSSQIKGRFSGLLQGLKDEGNEGSQLQSLMELCETLSIGTEESLAGFSLDNFVPTLVHLLNMEHNPDIMLLSCRALTYLLEALPGSTPVVVGHEAVPSLCQKLLNIEYIDLAEQALQCLEKISFESPSSILRAGGLMAVLTFLDFFPLGTQRTALSIAANICRQVVPESYDLVADAIPILTNLTQYQDSKLVEKAVICFSRLSDSFYDTDKLPLLAKYGLLSNLIKLISLSNTGFLTPSTYTLVLGLLTTFCYGSPPLVQSLLEEGEGIASVLQGALTSGMGTSETPVGGTPSGLSTEQLYEILSLINELLPPLPQEISGFLVSKPKPSLFGIKPLGLSRAPRKVAKPPPKKELKKSKSKEESEEEDEEEDGSNEESAIPMEVEGKESKTKEEKVDPRIKILSDNPKLLMNFAERLLSPLFQAFTSSVSQNIRYRCLTAITKILYYSTASMLRDLLRNLSVSSFIANLLSLSDMGIVATSLKMCEILMEKLPDIFDVYFKREGVLYEVERLSQLPEKKTSASQVVADEANNNESWDEWVRTFAKSFRTKYFEKTSSTDEAAISTQLKRLKKVSQTIKSLSNVKPSNEDNSILEELGVILCADESISTFEFVRSEIIESLLTYLTKVESSSPEEETSILTSRISTFCQVFLRPESLRKSEKVSPFSTLIQKLHQALHKVERFTVILNEVHGAPASGLKYLTQPFKLRLKKADDLNDPNIKDYSENIVLIEPLATIQAIQDFLVPRIKSDLRESKERDESLTSSSNINNDVAIEKKKEKSESSKEYLDEYDEEDEEEAEEEEDDEQEDQQFQENQPDPVHDLQLSPENRSPSSPILPQQNNLTLQVNNETLSPSTTVFQALQVLLRKNEENLDEHSAPQPIYRLWENVHTITYNYGPSQDAKELTKINQDYFLNETSITSLLKSDLYPVDDSTGCSQLLKLIKILNDLNVSWSFFVSEKGLSKRHILPPTDFVNSKITAKLTRQIQDLLSMCSGSFPDWMKKLPFYYTFLFPFEIRKLYFSCASFGIARALQALQQFTQGNSGVGIRSGNTEIRVGRIQRQKVRISRSKLLESARKVMDLYGKSKALLEIEYFDEVGTGLGPTLEFYTLVSRDIQRKSLGLWKDEKPTKGELNDDVSYVFASGGLFPAPIKSGSDKLQTVTPIFKFLGMFIAKALLDNRLLDLPLSGAFIKCVLGLELTFEDLKSVDPDFGASLEKTLDVVKQIKSIQLDSSLDDNEKRVRLESIKIGGATIDQLDLDFTLPGDPSWELKPDGSNISVTVHNLEEYLNLIVKTHLQVGISSQVDAFCKGFNEVFPISNLSLFTIEEIESLLRGKDDESDWDLQTLIENTRCDHGYSHNSQSVKDLLEVMTEFTQEERRKFLLFVTGSPRLPVGGFRSLDPKLTIVRKEFGKEDPDSVLPSVNCCFYYLKLPEYTSKKSLKDKLMFAIEHGQGSFSFN